MTPIQKSTLQKTTLECLAFGSFACLANTRYFVQYLPNLPKNGALLSGGAFILSSCIYNILRADPERSYSRTLLEKQILFFGASSIALYAAKITPRQAAGLGLATWLFSACVHRITDLSPLEKTHYSYTKHPQRWFNMNEKACLELSKRFFKADLPPIPGKVKYPDDKTLLGEKEMERLYKNPETFKRNQLGWIAQSMRFEINEESLRLLNYLFDNKIPIQNIASTDTDDENCKAFAQKLVGHDPLYYYAYRDAFGFIEDDIPLLGNLTKSLTPASIKRMAPHTLTLWNHSLRNDDSSIAEILNTSLMLAFNEQFWALNLEGINENEIRNQLLGNYSDATRENFNWCLRSLEISKKPIKIDDWMVPALHKAKTLGLKLPWFSVKNQQVDTNMLHEIYSKYPLYQFLETDADDSLKLQPRPSSLLINQEEDFPQGGEKLSPLPTFSSLVKGLTVGAIEALSLHDLCVWIHVFGRNEERWDKLDTRAQLALLKRYKEEFSGQELPEGINLKKIEQDVANFPEEFCRSDIEIYFEYKTEDKKSELSLSFLPLLIRAKNLKVDLSTVTINVDWGETLYGNSRNAHHLVELFRAYPQWQLTNKDEAVQEILKGAEPPLPTLDAIAKHLAPSIVKIIIEQDCEHIPFQAMPRDRSWVNLQEENLPKITQNQARWYLNLYGISRPCFEANPFEDEKINQLGKILGKCCSEYIYGLIVPVLYNPEDEYGLEQNVIKSLISKGFPKADHKTVSNKEACQDHILTKAPEKAFLIEGNELSDNLTFEEELFLRNQFLSQTVIALTARYVEYLEGNKEEAAKVSACYKEMLSEDRNYFKNVGIDKLPAKHKTIAQKLLT